MITAHDEQWPIWRLDTIDKKLHIIIKLVQAFCFVPAELKDDKRNNRQKEYTKGKNNIISEAQADRASAPASSDTYHLF